MSLMTAMTLYDIIWAYDETMALNSVGYIALLNTYVTKFKVFFNCVTVHFF